MFVVCEDFYLGVLLARRQHDAQYLCECIGVPSFYSLHNISSTLGIFSNIKNNEMIEVLVCTTLCISIF